MNHQTLAVAVAVVSSALAPLAAGAEGLCADAAQTATVRTYYDEHPGAQPAIAALRLGLPESVIASALPAGQAASASGEAFADIWAAMTEWREATFLIMKGQNVFEIVSPVGQGAPSERSSYFNIRYDQPLRGHLRPDQYAAIYAVAIPGRDDVVSRGVLFYAPDGTEVFGAFISGDSMETTPAEIAKFERLMEKIRAMPEVCTAQ